MYGEGYSAEGNSRIIYTAGNLNMSPNASLSSHS